MSESNGQNGLYHVFLAVPNAGSIMPCCMTAVGQATARGHKIALVPTQFGDICHNFNMMWTACLNMQHEHGFTHFAMLHTDITVSPGWLDTLLEELDRVDADVMAAIVPIKDGRGLTTTGFRTPGLWGTRRLSMREIMVLPETWTLGDKPEYLDMPNQILAINTGCWVCRFPKGGWPWKFPGFVNEHRIKLRDGQFLAEFDSEDWLFSEWLASQGLRVYVTRKVKTGHMGAFEFRNDSAWGAMQTDDWRPMWESMEAQREAGQARQVTAAGCPAETADPGSLRQLRPASADLSRHRDLLGRDRVPLGARGGDRQAGLCDGDPQDPALVAGLSD